MRERTHIGWEPYGKIARTYGKGAHVGREFTHVERELAHLKKRAAHPGNQTLGKWVKYEFASQLSNIKFSHIDFYNGCLVHDYPLH